MISFDRSWSRSLSATILAILVVPCNGPGDGGKASAQAPADAQSSSDRLRQMKALANTFTVAGVAADRPPLGPGAEPVFRYDEAARGFLDGTIWTFGGPGRPQAVLKAEIHVKGIVYGLVSLAPEALSASGINGWRWSSTRAGLDLKPIPGAPAPAATGRERLRQMRELARRFSALEDDGPVHGKFTLRLLPQPIHHYTDPASDNLDGAIFGFATGTNPDLLLVIESIRVSGPSASPWKYSFARIGGADLSGRLDGEVVWHEGSAFVPSRLATYANFVGPRDDLKP
jgi:hypothetical protein